MLSLVHFQYHSSRYRGSKLDTDCSKLLLILQKHLEETFLRGTRTLTLGQMSVSLKPRRTASALSGKISPWFDPVCGTKLEAMLAPETALWINEFLKAGILLSCPLSSACHLRRRAEGVVFHVVWIIAHAELWLLRCAWHTGLNECTNPFSLTTYLMWCIWRLQDTHTYMLSSSFFIHCQCDCLHVCS